MTDLRPRRTSRRVRRRRLVVAVVAGVVAVGLTTATIVWASSPAPAPTVTPSAVAKTPTRTPTPTPTATPTPTPPPFDKTALSIDDPMSIWVVADKLRPLNPLNFRAPDLVTANVPYAANATMRAEAAAALEQMFATAVAEGAGGMMVQNAFRSYETQVNVYAGHVSRLGQERADVGSARPGHSEHQTGLSADIAPDSGQCSVQECFAETSQGAWLAENAWRFGFHLRYPDGKTPITGYLFEPWHYRYIGVPLATELREQGVTTLEEFFGLPAAPAYP
ncbi:M15 family metallopeptidase [Homoserinimonas sp. A520]